MAIRFRCTECNHKLSAAEKTVGLKITCPICKAKIEVPNSSTLPPRKEGSNARKDAPAPESDADLKDTVAKLRNDNKRLEFELEAAEELARSGSSDGSADPLELEKLKAEVNGLRKTNEDNERDRSSLMSMLEIEEKTNKELHSELERMTKLAEEAAGGQAAADNEAVQKLEAERDALQQELEAAKATGGDAEKALHEQIDDLKKQLEAAHSEKAEASESAQSELTAQVDELQLQLNEAQAKLAEREASLAEKEALLADQASDEELVKKLEEKEQLINQLQEQGRENAANTGQLLESINSYNREISDLKTAEKKAVRALQKVENREQSILQEKESLAAKVEELNNTLNEQASQGGDHEAAIDQLRKELEQSRSEAQNAGREAAETRQLLDAANEELAGLRANLEDARGKLSSGSEEAKQFKQVREDLEDRLARAEKDAKLSEEKARKAAERAREAEEAREASTSKLRGDLQQMQERMESERASLEATAKTQKMAADSKARLVTELQEQLKNASRNSVTMATDIHELNSRIVDLEEQLNNAQESGSDHVARIEALQSDLEAVTRENDEAQKLISVAQQEAQEAKAALADAESAGSNASGELERLTDALTQEKQEAGTLRARVKQAEQNLQEARQQAEEHGQESDQLRTRLTDMQRALDDAEAAAHAAKEELEDATLRAKRQMEEIKDELGREAGSASRDLTDVRARAESAEARITELETELESQYGHVNSTTEQLNQTVSQMLQLRTENTKLKQALAKAGAVPGGNDGDKVSALEQQVRGQLSGLMEEQESMRKRIESLGKVVSDQSGAGDQQLKTENENLRKMLAQAAEEMNGVSEQINQIRKEGVRDAGIQARLEGLEVEREELLRHNQELIDQLTGI